MGDEGGITGWFPEGGASAAVLRGTAHQSAEARGSHSLLRAEDCAARGAGQPARLCAGAKARTRPEYHWLDFSAGQWGAFVPLTLTLTAW